MSRLSAVVFSVGFTAMVPASAASADYEMSGRWFARVPSLGPGAANVQWSVTHGGGQLQVEGWTAGGGKIHYTGTFDPVTGAFAVEDIGVTAMDCGPGRLEGTVDSTSSTFSGAYYVDTATWVPGQEPHGGHFECSPSVFGILGSRCGNEQIDAGESCDDGNGEGDDCCSPSCAITNDTATCDDNYGCGSGTCSSGECVLSAFSATGTTCNASSNPCVNDACDGAGNCVPSVNQPTTVACESDGNECTRDRCDGAGTCAHTPHTSACTDDGNPCTDDVCDGAGNCGVPNTAACASDDNVCTDDVCDGAGNCGHVPNTRSCDDDGNSCTRDVCEAGTCAHVNWPTGRSCIDHCGSGTCADGSCVLDTFDEPGSTCNADRNVCTPDTCDGAGTCLGAESIDCGPRATCDARSGCLADIPTGCDESAERVVTTMVTDREGDGRGKLSVQFKQAIPADDFGAPGVDTDYVLCLNEDDGLNDRPVVWMSVPAASTCRDEPCWEATSRGFRFKDASTANDGMASVSLDSARGMKLTARGENLPRTPDHLTPFDRLRATVIADDGVSTRCWSRAIVPGRASGRKIRWSYEGP